MFKNPGKQIQTIALFIFVILFIALLVAGIMVVNIFFFKDTYSVLLYIAVVILALLIAGFSTIFLYAYGTLIENVEILRKNSEYQREQLEEITYYIRTRGIRPVYVETNTAGSPPKE